VLKRKIKKERKCHQELFFIVGNESKFTLVDWEKNPVIFT
jgi:hypothetical protein